MVAKAHCIFTPFDSVTGAALLSATVNVYNPGTVTPISATIYDKNSNPLSNPLTSDASTGLVDFYLTVAQTVDLNVSKTGYTTRTYSNVMVLDDASFDNTAVLTTTGDLLYASGNNVPARLPVSGTTGALLNVAAGVPAWSTVLQLSTSAQAVGLGTAATTPIGLSVYPTNLTSTTQIGIDSNPTVTSAATANAIGIRSEITTAASSFTAASALCFVASAPTLGASSAITSMYGLYINNMGTTGVTNAYGIYVNAQSGAATSNISMQITGGEVLLGAAIATNATTGFVYIPGCAGAPTGAPANSATATAMVYDTSNNKIWFRSGGTWRGVVVS